MASLSPDQRAFLRDAVISTLLLAVPMALYRMYVEPSVLRIPGMILYLPLVFIYAVFGGRTENQFGPSAVQIGLYLLALGLLIAAVARFFRQGQSE